MDLPGGGYNQYWTRNVLFSPDGARMFVTVGSATNASVEPFPRASILVASPTARARRPTRAAYATPSASPSRTADSGPPSMSATTWATTSYRTTRPTSRKAASMAGPTSTSAATGIHASRFRPNVRLRPGIVPDVLLEAHCAALGIAFPPKGSRFQGAFVSMHGSWNRATRSGYKMVRALLDAKGNATGRYQDFVWGFATPEGRVWDAPSTWSSTSRARSSSATTDRERSGASGLRSAPLRERRRRMPSCRRWACRSHRGSRFHRHAPRRHEGIRRLRSRRG